MVKYKFNSTVCSCVKLVFVTYGLFVYEKGMYCIVLYCGVIVMIIVSIRKIMITVAFIINYYHYYYYYYYQLFLIIIINYYYYYY